MTETKYIFPKQPQSMAVLAFIAVPIILLLVLIVMVHRRNIFFCINANFQSALSQQFI